MGVEGSYLFMWCKNLFKWKGGNILECYYFDILKGKWIIFYVVRFVKKKEIL